MKYLYLTFLVLTFSNNYGQMSSFLKTTEYEKIKKEVGTINYYSWINDIKDDDSTNVITPNSFSLGESYGNNIFLNSEYAIFTYRFPAGTNCGTLIYYRKTNKIKIFSQICGNKIYGQKLEVDRHWITIGKGHDIQDGILDLKTMKVFWKKEISKTY